MKAKVNRGSGFRGWLNYGLDNKGRGAEIVGGNMSGHDARTLASEFGIFREMRPSCERPVVHFSLSAAPGEVLSPDQWQAVTSDFMKHMGLLDHAHVAIRHSGTNNDHIHIGGSRIGPDGNLWLGQWEARRAIAATQRIERDHGLILTPGLEDDEDTAPEQKAPAPGRKSVSKAEIEQADRTGEAPARMKLQEIIDAAFEDEPDKTVFAFIDSLEAAGVTALPNVAKTGRMNGFSFEIDGIHFKGSQLGKAFGWKALQERGIDYEQDRDGPWLIARADSIRNRGVEIDRGEPARADLEAGPAGAGFEHDQSEVRRISSGDRADVRNSDVAHFESDRASLTDTDRSEALPPAVSGPVDVAGSYDIDASLDRISDLAAPDPARDLGDGPVPPLTPAQKAKALSWAKQSEALGAPEYRLTLKSRVEGLVDFNMGKGKGADGAEIFYQPDAVAKMLPYLSRQNLVGYDIYITPIDKKHHYLLIDDSTPEKIDQMRSEGFAPALVQQSSAGNLQAIFKIHRIDQPREQKAANALVVTLNKAYGDPKLSGVIHPFRMAGFANKKPGRNNAFTRVIEAAGVICGHAAAWLADIRDKMKPAPAPLPKKPSKIAKIEPSVSQPADLRFIDIWEREKKFAQTKSWNVDLSILDYRVAKSMLSDGFTSSDVAGAMQRKSPDIETRHPNTAAYINQTVNKAGLEVGRQSRPDVVSTPPPNKDKEDDNEPGGL